MEGETQVAESTQVATETQAEPAFIKGEPATVTESNDNKTENTEKPAGWDQVNLTPEQQARFDRVYGNMKRFENSDRESKQAIEILTQRLTELTNNQQQVVQHLQQEDFTNAEDTLRVQKIEALNKGDMDAYERLNDKLLDIKVAKKTAAKQQVQQPQKQVEQQNSRNLSANDIVNRAIQSGDISPTDVNVFNAWNTEKDGSGSLKRPWTDANHPHNEAAATEGKAVFNNPIYAGKTFAQKLQIIDQRMGIMPQPQQQNVLGAGNLTANKKSSNVKLSPYQEKVAIRTKFGGSKAKSDSDHVEAFRQAVIKSQTKGARR